METHKYKWQILLEKMFKSKTNFCSSHDNETLSRSKSQVSRNWSNIPAEGCVDVWRSVAAVRLTGRSKVIFCSWSIQEEGSLPDKTADKTEPTAARLSDIPALVNKSNEELESHSTRVTKSEVFADRLIK